MLDVILSGLLGISRNSHCNFIWRFSLVHFGWCVDRCI